MARRAVGIDIGESSVKVAELEYVRGKVYLASCDVVDFGLVPGEGAENRDEIVIEVLRRIFEEKKLRSKVSILSVSGQSVFIRTVKLPMVGKAKLDRIVRYEAQQQVPFPIEEIAWDYQVIPPRAGAPEKAAEGGVDVRLVAIKSELVDQIIRPAVSIKLYPEIIDVGVLAMYNCLDFVGLDLVECQAVLEIGARTTNISVISNREIWTRSVPIAGNTFSREIKNAMKIPFPEAESLKLQHGVLLDPARVKELHMEEYEKAVNGVLIRFVAEVTRSFSFYKTQICPDDIKKVHLIGGVSEMKNLDRVLEERLKLPVTRLDPVSLIPVRPEFGILFDVSSVGHLLGTAIGLALRRLRRNPIEINLLPPRMIQQQRLAKGVRHYVAAGGVLLVSVMLLWLNIAFEGRRLVAKDQEIKLAIDSVTRYSTQLEKVRQSFKEIDQKMAWANTVRARRRLWLKLLLELERCIPENIWILSLSQTQESAEASPESSAAGALRRRAGRTARVAAAAATPAADTSRDVFLVGQTNGTYKDITEFADLLKKVPSFEPEEIKILTAKPPVNGVREFTMKAVLRREAAGQEPGK